MTNETFTKSDYECESCDQEKTDVVWREEKEGYFCDECVRNQDE